MAGTPGAQRDLHVELLGPEALKMALRGLWPRSPGHRKDIHVDIHGLKPFKFIGFGDIQGPKPYTFIGFGELLASKRPK